ncbi:RNA-directed DNA polymerase, eukaryota [Tanacetum coccineum]
MESLHISFSRAINDGFFKGIQLHGSVTISHLFYADDAMFVGEWSDSNLLNIVNVLNCFFLASGLKINIQKSQLLGVGVPNNVVQQAANLIGCGFLRCPFRYLGVMIGNKMSRKSAWDSTIQKLQSKLSKWKVKTLSIGVSLTLLKSNLWCLAWMLLLDLCEVVPVYQIFIYVFKCRYRDGGIWPDIISATKSIGHIDADFERSFVRKVNNGSDTLFWKDQWCCNGVRLMESFPRLFALETHKDCSISDHWGLNNNEGGWKWAWRFPHRGRANNDLESLISFVGSLNLSVEDRDVWKWALDGSGNFKVCTLSKRIQNLLLANFIVGNHHLWNSLIPRKVNICVWRASLNRLPTRANLSSRGVMLESSTCPFCENVIEDLDHSAINCPVVLPIWRKVWCWWNLASPVAFPSFSISDISTGNIGPDGNAKMGKIIHGVFQISLWAIWKWRNRIVNASADSSPKIKEEDIFPAIQRLSRTWIAARLVSNSANWDVWISRPYDLFS